VASTSAAASLGSAARICAVHEARRGLALPDLQVPPLQNFAALRVVFSARKRHFCARGRGLPEDDDEDVEATETKPPEVESGGAAIAAITISSFITCMQQERRDGASQDFSYKIFSSCKQTHFLCTERPLTTTTTSDPLHTPRRRKSSKQQQQQQQQQQQVKANSAFFLMLF